MANDTQSPSFMSGLMSGLNSLGSNPLFNIGMGLMSAGSHPFGDVGASLMQANANTTNNQLAQQDAQMKRLQFQKQMAQQEMFNRVLQARMGGSPQATGAGPGIAAPDPGQTPAAPGLGGLMGSAVAPGAPPPGIAAPPPAPTPQPSAMGGQNAPAGAPMFAPQDALDLGTLGSLIGMPGADALAKYPESYGKVQDAQQKLRQQQAQGPLAMFDTIATADNAKNIVNSNMTLKAHWNQIAPQMGLDPKTDFTDANVRKYATFAYNQMAGGAGLPPKPMPNQTQMIKLPDGRIAQVDPLTNKMDIQAAGPDVITAEDKIRNATQAAELKVSQQNAAREAARAGVPMGYERDPADPAGATLRPMQGGPHDPNAVGNGLDGRSQVQFQRVIGAGNSAVESLKNIMALPSDTSSGWLGGVHSNGGILSSVKSVLAGKVTPQGVQDYQSMLAGVSRNLATLETEGLAPPGSLTHSLDAMELKEGDSNLTRLRKTAEMRQIIVTNLEPQLSSNRLAPAQRQIVKDIIAGAKEAVPYTHADITALQQSNNPKATIMDFAKGKGLGGGAAAPSSTPPPGQRRPLASFGN